MEDNLRSEELEPTVFETPRMGVVKPLKTVVISLVLSLSNLF